MAVTTANVSKERVRNGRFNGKLLMVNGTVVTCAERSRSIVNGETGLGLDKPSKPCHYTHK